MYHFRGECEKVLHESASLFNIKPFCFHPTISFHPVVLSFSTVSHTFTGCVTILLTKSYTCTFGQYIVSQFIVSCIYISHLLKIAHLGYLTGSTQLK